MLVGVQDSHGTASMLELSRYEMQLAELCMGT